MLDDLYIVTPFFNPLQYQSRIRLQRNFIDYIRRLDLNLIVIELAFNDAQFELGADINLNTDCVFWHKERLINLAVEQLPYSWKYIAWIDGDVKFLNDKWYEDTINLLQIYPVLQLFDSAIDLSPNDTFLRMHKGYASSYSRGFINQVKTQNFHSGFAWACTRDFFNKIGGLIDYSILGSADRQMADCFANIPDIGYYRKFSDGYKEKLDRFHELSQKAGGNHLNYVNGTLVHYWHGKKKNRGYATRQNILIKHKFDPNIHLVREWNGLDRLNHDKLALDICQYFVDRQEDDTLIDNCKY